MLKKEFIQRFGNLSQFPYFTKNSEELKYFIEYGGSYGYLLIYSFSEFVFYTDARYYDEYAYKLGKENVVLLTSFESPFHFLLEELKKREIKELYFDQALFTHEEFLLLEKELKKENLKLKKLTKPILELRKIKDKTEIEKIKKAQEITDKVLFTIMDLFKAGVYERDISNEIGYQMKKLGAQNTAFESIVLFGERTSFPHGESGSVPLKKGDVILIDTGALYEGYHSDITRMMSFGEPKDKEFIKHYETVLSSQKECIEKIKVKMAVKDLDLFVRNKLKAQGLEKYFTHSLGHGVGLHIHELPRISSGSLESIQKGFVFSIEPGVYLNGRYGIRIEDLVWINPFGEKEVLSFFPKDLLIL
jgi:Xaa-Pro aminopeptidase